METTAILRGPETSVNEFKLLAGRDADELAWRATLLRQALELNPGAVNNERPV
jgi:hypothetical protein